MGNQGRMLIALTIAVFALAIGLSTQPDNGIVNLALLPACAAVFGLCISPNWSAMLFGCVAFLIFQVLSRIPFFTSTAASEWGFFLWFGIGMGIPFVLLFVGLSKLVLAAMLRG